MLSSPPLKSCARMDSQTFYGLPTMHSDLNYQAQLPGKLTVEINFKSVMYYRVYQNEGVPLEWDPIPNKAVSSFYIKFF